MSKPSTDLVPVGTYPDLDAAHELELRELEAEGQAPALDGDDAPDIPAAADPTQVAALDEDDRPTSPAATAPDDSDETPKTTTPALPKGAAPFAFKADGKEVAVPGAFEQRGYVVVPRKAWDSTVQKHLADRQVWAQKEGQYRAALGQAQQALQDLEASIDRHPAVIQSLAAVAELNELLKAGPDAMDRWLLDFEKNRDKLLRDITERTERMKREADIRAREQRLEEQTARERAAALPAVLDDLVRRNLAYYATQPGFEALAAPAVQAAVFEAFRDEQLRTAMFVEATEDIPGRMKKGQVDVNRAYFESLLRMQVRQAAQAGATAKAKDFNAAALGKRRRPVPPDLVPGGTPPVPPERPAKKQYRTLDDWADENLK